MLKKLSPQFIRPYGKIIHYPNQHKKGNKRNLWRIVHTESAKVGWRIAYLVLRDKTIGRLECHPTSDETFEPVKGKALMFIAKDRNLESIEAFVLDKPIVLNKGIWHGLVALEKDVEIKIVENAKVTCKYWKLPARISSLKQIKERIKKTS